MGFLEAIGAGKLPIDNSHSHSKSKNTSNNSFQAPGTTPAEKNISSSLGIFTNGKFDTKNIDRSGRAITNEELGTTFDISQGANQPVNNIAQLPSPIQDIPVSVPTALDVDSVNMNAVYNS